MVDTHKTPGFNTVIRRSSIAFSAFAITLLFLLSASWFFVLPKLTKIEVAGSVRNVQELKRYQGYLLSEIDTLIEKRNQLILPIQDPVYLSLRTIKQDQPLLEEIVPLMREVGKKYAVDNTNTVFFSAMNLERKAGTYILTAQGSIENVGPRCMTILAQYIESLRTVPMIKDVQSAKFVRRQAQSGEYYSPFYLTITL